MNAVVQLSSDAAPAGAKSAPVADANAPAANSPASGARTKGQPKPKGKGYTAPRRPPPGINGFEIPVGAFRQKMPVTLRSAEAIRLATRGFASAQESLYNITVVLPRHQEEDQDAIRQTEASLDLLFEQMAADLREDLLKVRALAKKEGVTIQEDNYQPLVESVDLATGHAVKLLNIIKDYDEMSCITFALTFCGQLKNSERVRLYSTWRNRLGKFIRSLKMHYLELRGRGSFGATLSGGTDQSGEDLTEDALAEELERLDAQATADAGTA